MIYHKIKFNNKNLGFIIIVLIVFIIFVLVSGSVKAYDKNTKITKNSFYSKIFNYTLPMAKVVSSNTEDSLNKENEPSLKEKLLKVVGLDIKDPISVVGREVSFLKEVEDQYEITENEEGPDDNQGIGEFTLNKDSISKDVINNNTSEDLPNNVVSVYDPKLKKKKSIKPEIFIYHTHTTEAYAGSVSSMDSNKSVCAVGDTIEKELEENYGIGVVHDKTIHDAYAYTKAYQRSGVTVDKYLKKYGDFKMVIDLHRDSIENKRSETIKMNGEYAAKFMFVMARKNPHFQKNMQVVNTIEKISDKLCPGFCKGVLYRNYGVSYYNQGKSNHAILIEVGSDINTLDEAKNSGKYIARIIAEALNSKN